MDLSQGMNAPGGEGVVESCLVREPWGEVWRGSHPRHGAALFVVYTGPHGPALFAEALPGLRRWQQVAQSGTCPELIAIHEIREGSPAVVVAADPGGPTLREIAAKGPIEPRKAMTIVRHAARAVLLARSYDTQAAGLSPDLLFQAPAGSPADAPPWRLLPVGPNAPRAIVHVAGGRYLPPETAGHPSFLELCPDSYGLAWLAVELIAGDFMLPRDHTRIKEWIPYARLRTMLANGLTPAKGSYGDPKLIQLGIDRWLKTEAVEDIAEVEAAKRATERPPALNWIHQHRRTLIQAGVGVLVLLVILCGIYAVPRMLTPGNTTKTPYGVTNLFFEALVARDANKARGLAQGEGAGQVDRILEEIARMERDGLASPFAKAVPQVAGAGPARTVKVDLKGKNNDLFMIAEMTIRETATGDWKVDTLFFEPTRTKEN